MDQTTPNCNDDYTSVYALYESAIECLEEYEQNVGSDHHTWESLLYYQGKCADVLHNIIQLEENSLYFTALAHIREDLYQHINSVQEASKQIIFNGLIITKLDSKSETESFPSNRSVVANDDSINVQPPKKAKTELDTDRLENTIKNTIVVSASKGLDDIAGLAREKTMLKEAIVFPRKFPHLFTGARKPWTKALLFGPPGTGKTQLAHSLAAEVGAQFHSVSTADMLSRYVGESEKLVRTLFQYCQQNPRQSIIFVDEVDGMCRKRQSSEADYDRRVKNELLSQMSTLDRNENNSVFLLAATNCPWDIDPAFIRRFQRRIYIPLPDRETRLSLLKLQLTGIDNSITNDQWTEILNRTEGWSGSDISDLVNCALNQPLKDLDNTKHWEITEDNKIMPCKQASLGSFKRTLKDLPSERITVRGVEIRDFFVGFQTVTKTNSIDDIKKFNEFNQSFGTQRNIVED